MKVKISQAEFDKIEELVNCALSANNKAEAQKYISQIRYVCMDLNGYANTVLHSLISSVERASGRVTDKERLKGFAYTDLVKLQGEIEKQW